MIEGRGFTLIELLVVVAVIAVLSFFAEGYYSEYVQQARRAVVKNNVKVVRDALARYFKDRMSYPINLDALTGPYLQETPSRLLVEPWAGANVSIYVEVSKCRPLDRPDNRFETTSHPHTPPGPDGWADENPFLATETYEILYLPGGAGNVRQIKNFRLKLDDEWLPW